MICLSCLTRAINRRWYLVSLKCFVYGCKTGYNSDFIKGKVVGEKKIFFFSPPQLSACLIYFIFALQAIGKGLLDF